MLFLLSLSCIIFSCLLCLKYLRHQGKKSREKKEWKKGLKFRYINTSLLFKYKTDYFWKLKKKKIIDI